MSCAQRCVSGCKKCLCTNAEALLKCYKKLYINLMGSAGGGGGWMVLGLK